MSKKFHNFHNKGDNLQFLLNLYLFRFLKLLLLEVKLPYEPVCPLSVGHTLLKRKGNFTSMLLSEHLFEYHKERDGNVCYRGVFAF